MKAEDFVFAMNETDDKYITEPFEENKTGKIIPFKKWAAVAACIVLSVFMVVVATAKPEYRLWFEKTVTDDGTAFFVFAELEKFPLGDFSENTKQIEKDIIRQYVDYEPYMSSLPGHWYRYFPSFKEAEEFIGFKGFVTPELDIPEKDASVSVFGDSFGKISRIGAEFFYLDTNEGYLGIQIFADALTVNFDEEIFQFNMISPEEYGTLKEFKNKKGTRFYIFEGEKSKTGNSRTAIYFIKNGVLYFGNFAYSEEKTEKAKSVMEDFLNFY